MSGGFEFSQLLGPAGGIISLAYGAGCASGWVFCNSTQLKIANRRIDELHIEMLAERAECNRRIQNLEDDNRRLARDMRDEMKGMKAQLKQVRQSSTRIIPPR